ncbi:MAG: LuxR C-terminal-related transcriptional regulator [Bacillota bacterium]|nr:LuxR C-terminal-related transcriptional regulator [Bacillota bacterium]
MERGSSPWRIGLAGAGIFAWLLTMPFYGPLLFRFYPEAGVWYGHTFAFSHAAGLVLGPWYQKWFGAKWLPPLMVIFILAAGATGACSPLPSFLGTGYFIVLGIGAAFLVLTWVQRLADLSEPLLPLGLTMAGSNILLQGANLPGIPLPFLKIYAFLLSVLCGLSFFLLSRLSVKPRFGSFRSDRSEDDWFSLLLFALAAYAGGGLVYRALTPTVNASPAGASLGAWPYIIAVAPLAFFARCVGRLTLIPWSLGLLGLGFSLWATGSKSLFLVLPAYAGVMIGLAGADLYYWLSLCQLTRQTGSMTPFAWGLAWNVFVIGFTGLLWDCGLISAGNSGLAGIIGAAILFCLIPLLTGGLSRDELFPSRQTSSLQANPLVSPKTVRAQEKRGEESGLPAGTQPGPQFTPAEQKVIELLLAGCPDRVIASTLFISPNTVKFHVRNILRKSDCQTRKEFCSRFASAFGITSEITGAVPQAAPALPPPTRDGTPPPEPPSQKAPTLQDPSGEQE